VTRSVPDFHLVLGNPARSIGCVCRCGEPLMKWDDRRSPDPNSIVCSVCETAFEICEQVVNEVVDAEDMHAIVRHFSAEQAEDKNVA
jgi:UDP-2-acetamido-3-amino-2,3-dideoxy-glucuronate N-acetyltransferase